jgi:hypothetical protein
VARRGSTLKADRSHADLSPMPGGYIAIAVGAFLDFAVRGWPRILGVNFHTLGLILISVGCLSVFLPAISNLTVGLRRKRTIIEDDGGYGHRRGEAIFAESSDSDRERSPWREYPSHGWRDNRRPLSRTRGPY